MKQLYIANLNEDKGSFNFNHSFSEIGIQLIQQAQQEKQIRNQQGAQDLFIASSFMFTGFEVFWSIKQGRIEREQSVICALETMFDVAPEYAVQNESNSLHFENFQ